MDQSEKNKFNYLVQKSKINTVIEGFFTVENASGSKAQLAKIHAMINDLSTETGQAAMSIKEQLKNEMNFYTSAKGIKEYRSFGKASLEELSEAIERLYLMGEFCNINFRIQY